MQKLYKIKEVKDILGTTRQYVYNRIKTGDFKIIKDKGFIRITEDSLNEYLRKYSKM